MRIRGYGSGYGGSSGRDAERKGAFRRRFQVGDRVRATLLRWERPGFAWVEVGDLELLASLSLEAKPGQMLHFLVKELYPEIVLQEFSGGAGTCGYGAGGPGIGTGNQNRNPGDGSTFGNSSGSSFGNSGRRRDR